MTYHCSEIELQTLDLSPESLSEAERERMVRHLGKCSFCRELMEKMHGFNKSVGADAELPASEKDIALARRLLSGRRLVLPAGRERLAARTDSLAETFASVIEPYRSSLPKRFVRYVRHHPVRSFAAASIAAALMVLAVITLRPRVDRNPVMVDVLDGFLVTKNGHGEELWRKYLGPSFNFPNFAGIFLGHPDRAIRIEDVDRDGKNEVLCIFGWTSGTLPENNLILCYNGDGTERWRYELRRTMTLGGVLYSDLYRFYHLETGDFAHTGNVEVWAAARHDPWHPNVLVRLDARNGKLLGEYWHPGQLRSFDHKDLDHDGVEELVFGGQNNRLKHASVVVFDARMIGGGAPAPENYYPKGFPPGTEKYYLLFPSSDLMTFSTDVTNEVESLRITADGMIEVTIDEPARQTSGTLYYYFDSTMACISVRPSDSYTAAHRLFEQEGKLTSHLDDDYFEALRRGVLYWDGEKFVGSPVENRHYREFVSAPPHP
jgi:hypothetical protein